MEWISVKTRVPEKGEAVYVTASKGLVRSTVFYEEGGWWTYSDTYGYNEPEDPVEYWIPRSCIPEIPDIPKGK